MAPSNAIVTSLQSLATEVLGTLGAVAPIAIGIFGVFMGWRYAKSLFKTVSK